MKEDRKIKKTGKSTIINNYKGEKTLNECLNNIIKIKSNKS
jgi:hypothetical protein